MRVIQREGDRAIFTAEVECWLIGELTEADRINTHERVDLIYQPEYAMYCVMAYHKGRYMEGTQRI